MKIKRNMKKISKILLYFIIITTASVGIISNEVLAQTQNELNNSFNHAKEFFKNGEYKQAITIYDKILEIGAGNGSNINFYNNYDKLVLLDSNFDLIKQIDKSSSYNLILADINYLPFKEQSFDSIVSSLVLCSVSNVNSTFKELNMVLKTKGKYFFWEHTVFHKKSMIIFKSFFIYTWKFFTNGCDYNIDNVSNLESIKWGHIKLHKKYSSLIKFLGIYYIYGVITKK